MDEPGLRARRRAAKQDAYYADPAHRQPQENLEPLPEDTWDRDVPHPGKIPNSYGYAEPSDLPPQYVDPSTVPGATQEGAEVQGTTNSSGPHLAAVQRTQALPRPARMNPPLQFLCGPLLRYDTVVDNVWHGAAMIVTSDAGSQYSPTGPTLSLAWDPEKPTEPTHGLRVPTNGHTHSPSIEPYDPHHSDISGISPIEGHNADHAPPISTDTGANGHARKISMRAQIRNIPGQEIWVYHGAGGTFTFWRFMIAIPLDNIEMAVRYRVNGGGEVEFFVPAIGQNLRWAAHSCNGFSAGVNPDDFRGPGFQSGYDPLWSDMYTRHRQNPYHCMVGGGDQIYCDSLTREPELQEWMALKTNQEKVDYPITDTIRFAIDRFYFSHYCLIFRQGMFARCNRSIPMVNMLDDHDLIDGFGSYPADLQSSPVFSTIGSRGYFYFLLFQQFTVDAVDGTGASEKLHPNKALVLGADGPWIPFKSHSLVTYLGPKVYMLLLDCRAERKKNQICSEATYDKIWANLATLPRTVEHLVVQIGIPIAYPRMNFMESALDSKLNPLTILGRNGSLGLTGFVNKFNKEAELLDDLNDHWTAKHHKQERNWLVQELQRIAQTQQLRISFLSGDVHCAAVGVFKTLVKGKKAVPIEPALDRRYMLNIVTSAIVNTPPPNPVLTMVSLLGKRAHKTLHHAETDEIMIQVFEKDTDGVTPPKSTNIMGRRNWTSVELNEKTGELVFDIRVEREKGVGETVGYPVPAPPPRWTS